MNKIVRKIVRLSTLDETLMEIMKRLDDLDRRVGILERAVPKVRRVP